MTSRMNRLAGTLSSTYLACFIFIFMEWLFFVTKPSMLTYYTMAEKVSVIFLSPVILFVSILPFVLMIFILEESIPKKLPVPASGIPKAVVYACVVLLLVDNFTDTIFGFSAGDFTGIGRQVYLLLFLFVLIGLFLKSGAGKNEKQSALMEKGMQLTTLGLFLIGLGFAAGGISKDNYGETNAGITGTNNLPNILILSSDGINAANMSAYGYERQTTPFIETLLDTSLVSLNHFSNAANTSGSVISLLTGKLPITTRVIFQPDMLRGEDAYEHLPGILQKLGYTNADISIRHYADGLDLNLQQGFHLANNRRNIDSPLARIYEPVFRRYPQQGLFMEQSFDRISERLLHITGIRDMENVFGTVTSQVQTDSIDRGRIETLYKFMDTSQQPFFIHLHLMGTHGPRFLPQEPLYSSGEEQSEDYMVDFYDDAIRDFDTYVADTYDYLADRGILDNTVLVINSDHSRRPDVGQRVPLIMKFPDNRYAGLLESNTQRIDIAPTILDYLGVPVPDWMEGSSLLAGEPGERLIYTFSTATTNFIEGVGWEVLNPKPPFFTLNGVFVVDCNHFYEMRITQQTWSDREIPEYATPCPAGQLHSPEEILDAIKGKLVDYDLSSLDWLDAIAREYHYFTLSNATLVNGVLYIPAIHYQDDDYAALLRPDDDGNYRIVNIMPAADNLEVARFDNSSRSVILPGVDRDGESVDMVLTLLSSGPPVFSLTTAQ